MPRPQSRYQQNQTGTGTHSVNQSISGMSKRESTKAGDDYSDDDYEEGFEAADAGGEDEMEKLRKAMEKEKLKAQKHKELKLKSDQVR